MPYKFYGGVHPLALKTLTLDRPIKRAYIPKKVVLPLSQHVGSACEPVVSVGSDVKVGDPVGKPAGFISSAVHAAISGRITGISYHPTPTQNRVLSVTIESQGTEDQDFKPVPVKDIQSLSRENLLDRIKDAGIVGMGGAAFPTHVKLSPPKTRPIDTVILNGAECEPYLTGDHRLMLEKPKEILKGLEIIAKVLGVKNAYIAIEDNKLSAIYAIERILSGSRDVPRIRRVKPAGDGPDIKVAILETKYPQGAEKQVIKSVLNRVVPAGALPMEVGCIVQNIGTAFAVYEAVCLGKPLIERVVTITGPCVREPMNLWVRIGTLLSELACSLGPFAREPRKVIAGGPMMGIAQYTTDVPVVKGTGGVIFLSDAELDRSQESVCIRCAKCLEACPMGLAPTSLMNRVKKERFTEAEEMGMANCFECGACAYACPAKIPLVDYIKFGKAKIQKV